MTARFAGKGASLQAPLVTNGGDGTLVVRAAQLAGAPRSVGVIANGTEIGRFDAPPGHLILAQWQQQAAGSPFEEMHTYRLPVRWPAGAFRLQLAVEKPEELGVAVDRVDVEGLRWRVPFGALAPRALVIGGFAIALIAGLPLVAALATGGTLALVAAGWAALDPFAMVHATERFAWPALLLTAGLALVVRKRGGLARWVVIPFLAGYVVKGAFLFHPSIYYPDVLQHYRYAAYFAAAEGSIAERGREAQERARSATRQIAGRNYVMPYSPLYYVPFTWLGPQRRVIEDAMRQASLAAAAAEVAIVFAMAALVFGAGAGVWAATLAAFLPPLESRLLYAQWPSVFGHLLDMLAVLATLAYALRPSRRRLAIVGGAMLAAVMTYVSSPFTLIAFSLALTALAPRKYWRILAVAMAASALTAALLYRPFVGELVTEIIPAWRHAPAATAASASPPSTSTDDPDAPGTSAGSGLAASLSRVPLFFGFVYPLLALVGVVLARRTAPTEGARVVYAYGLAVVGLFVFKGITLGLFRDIKEVEFAGPFVAITAGATLAALAAWHRIGRVGAIAAAAALIAFGLARFVEYATSAVWFSR